MSDKEIREFLDQPPYFKTPWHESLELGEGTICESYPIPLPMSDRERYRENYDRIFRSGDILTRPEVVGLTDDELRRSIEDKPYVFTKAKTGQPDS